MLVQWGGGVYTGLHLCRSGVAPSDVLERPCTAGGGRVPAPLDPPPPLLPVQCLRLTATILLRRLRCQEDLGCKIFGPPSAGSTGGPWEEGDPSQTPLPPFRPPSPPSNPPPPPCVRTQSWDGRAACLCDQEDAMPWPTTPRWAQRRAPMACPTGPGAPGHTCPPHARPSPRPHPCPRARLHTGRRHLPPTCASVGSGGCR